MFLKQPLDADHFQLLRLSQIFTVYPLSERARLTEYTAKSLISLELNISVGWYLCICGVPGLNFGMFLAQLDTLVPADTLAIDDPPFLASWLHSDK